MAENGQSQTRETIVKISEDLVQELNLEVDLENE